MEPLRLERLVALLAMLVTVFAACGVTAAGNKARQPKGELLAWAERNQGENRAACLSVLARDYGGELTAGDLDRIAPFLKDPHALVRMDAAKALIRGNSRGESYIADAIGTLPVEQALTAATAYVYGTSGDPARDAKRAVPALEKGLFDRRLDGALRIRVAERLGVRRVDLFQPLYVKMLDADLSEIRRNGVNLAQFSEAVYDKLAALTRDEDRHVRYAVAWKLRRAVAEKLHYGEKVGEVLERAVPILRQALDEKDDYVLAEIIQGIRVTRDSKSLPRLVEILKGTGEPSEEKGLSEPALEAGRAIAAITGRRFNFERPRFYDEWRPNGKRVYVIGDDLKEVHRRHLRERKRLLEWWDAEGSAKHADAQGDRKP